MSTAITVGATSGGAERPLPDWMADVLTAQAQANATALSVAQLQTQIAGMFAMINEMGWATASGVLVGSGNDQSAPMQQAIDACAGKTLILPPGDIYAKGLRLPHLGVKLVGTPARYSVTGTGTRFVLPNGANTYIAASECYANNWTWANYGAEFDGVSFDGNKANQTSAAPLLVLRTARSHLRQNCTVSNSKGAGLLLTAPSANGATVNSMPENTIEGIFANCDDEGISGVDGGLNKLADTFIRRAIVFQCGIGVTKKYAVNFDRFAGCEMTDSRFYMNGLGNLKAYGSGASVIARNNFQMATAIGVTGTVYDVDVSVGGWASLKYQGNEHFTDIGADAVARQHAIFRGWSNSTRIAHVGNGYSAYNRTTTAWTYVGNAGGRVTDVGTESFQATEPATSANIRRAVYA